MLRREDNRRVRGCADEDWDNLDWSKAPAIQEMPVTSAILSPTPGHAVKAEGGKVAVSGYALAGGGRAIIRVDVSADGGKTWTAARLLPVPEGLEQGYRRNWAWRHWEARPRPSLHLPLACLHAECAACVARDASLAWDAHRCMRGTCAAPAWHIGLVARRLTWASPAGR